MTELCPESSTFPMSLRFALLSAAPSKSSKALPLVVEIFAALAHALSPCILWLTILAFAYSGICMSSVYMLPLIISYIAGHFNIASGHIFSY